MRIVRLPFSWYMGVLLLVGIVFRTPMLIERMMAAPDTQITAELSEPTNS